MTATTNAMILDDSTRAMVRGWVVLDGGDQEQTARWMRDTLHLGSVTECRRLVRLAMEG